MPMTKPTSEQVTFLAAGSGATQRTALDKLRDVVSVKDFGATGDGVTNDTTAINAAIAFCKGGAGKQTLYFPAGTYAFSETVAGFGLYVNAAMKIVGDGPTRTILKNTSATGAGLRCASGFIIVQDLTIDQNGSTGIGFRCPGQYGVVRNVQITNQAGSNYAFVADGATLVQIDSLHILNATNGISIAATTPTQYLTFTHCSVEFTQRGLTAGASSEMTFTELYFEPVNGTTSFVHVMEVSNSLNYQFFGLNMELFGLPSNANVAAIMFTDCRNFNIFGSKVFENQANMTNAQLVRVDGASTRSINFTGMDFQTSSTGLTLFRVQNSPYQITWRNIRANGNPAGTGIDYTGSSGNGLNVENWTSSNAAFNLKLRSNDMYVNCADANTGIEFLGSDTNMSVINCRGALSGAGASLIFHPDNIYCTSGATFPKTDGTADLGASGNKWDNIYAANGTIITSDERSKQDIRTLSLAESLVAGDLKSMVKAFRFRSAVADKGDDARIHVGMVAQDVRDAFLARGLDPSRYGMFCYDEWDEIVDGNGNVIRPAGSSFGVRMDQVLAFIVSAT
jgi:hypothetical protein